MTPCGADEHSDASPLHIDGTGHGTGYLPTIPPTDCQRWRRATRPQTERVGPARQLTVTASQIFQSRPCVLSSSWVHAVRSVDRFEIGVFHSRAARHFHAWAFVNGQNASDHDNIGRCYFLSKRHFRDLIRFGTTRPCRRQSQNAREHCTAGTRPPESTHPLSPVELSFVSHVIRACGARAQLATIFLAETQPSSQRKKVGTRANTDSNHPYAGQLPRNLKMCSPRRRPIHEIVSISPANLAPPPTTPNGGRA